MKALGPINPFKTGNLLTPKVAGANIALYYYAGFSYLMLQRYLDATRAFNTVLQYINRYFNFALCLVIMFKPSPLSCSASVPIQVLHCARHHLGVQMSGNAKSTNCQCWATSGCFPELKTMEWCKSYWNEILN